MDTFIQTVKAWTKPDKKRKICLNLMAAGSICFFISLVLKEIYQYDIFTTNNIFPIASSIFTVAAIVYGIASFVRPIDVIIMIIFFASMDMISLLVIGVISTIFHAIITLVVFSIFAFLLIAVLYAVLAFAGAFLPIVILIYLAVLLYQSVDAVAALLHTNIILVIVGTIAILLTAVYTTVTKGNEKRKSFEIIVAIVLAYFIAWPLLSATNNINGVLANKLGKEYKLMDNQGYRVVRNDELTVNKFSNDCGGIKTDYYNIVINNHGDGNISNSLYADAYYGDLGFYTISLDGKELVAHVNSWDRRNKPYTGSTKDVSVIQYSNWSLFMTDKKLIGYKLYNNNVFESVVFSKKWKEPIKNVNDEEFRKVIMADLVNQIADRGNSSYYFDIEAFARVAYAQKNGYLVDFDNATSTAVFASTNKNKITFVYYNEAGNTEEIATIERKYKGNGVGYFKYQDDIYYVDDTKVMKLHIPTKEITTLTDQGQTIYSLNYVVLSQDLAIYYIQENSDMVQYYCGEVVSVSSNGLYKAKDVIGFNYCNNHLVITYKATDYSIFKKLIAFILNKEIPSKPIGIAYIKFK